MSADIPEGHKDQGKQTARRTSCAGRRPSTTSPTSPATSRSKGLGAHTAHNRISKTRLYKGRTPSRTMATNQSAGSSAPTSPASPIATSGSGFPPGRLGARRAARSPALQAKLKQMALPLAPLVQVTTGAVHREFPANLLCFWLLTDAQLDALAAFYHQRDPCAWTLHYPCPVAWRPGMTLEEKRRKLGKFIGLRGCDTPVAEWSRLREEHGEAAELLRLRTEEEIMAAARRARDRQREEEELFKRKLHW